ncbi:MULTISPECIES: deoxyribonuclease IV [Calditerrivibrio]|uniref:Probable endonuclease 4 n=1 Tax=Calditerrivibrio nitroreducens TaxID=477976 RepID=A0A2J6WJP2_9BACT|nr:MAG: deoxyribonuclease IV [Calditerrivibrio nitroreducens]
MILGAHESIAGGIYNSIKRGFDDGAESLQIFVKSSNRWFDKPLKESDVEKYFTSLSKYGFLNTNVCAHSSYLINLASEGETYEKSYNSMKDELIRCDVLKIPYYIIHPGSHLGVGVEEGLKRVIKFVDKLYEENGFRVMTLFETTAGQGTNLGSRLEEIEYLIENSRFSAKLGICLDSCHLYSAGYDILNNYDGVFDDILKRFGDKVKVFHINDTKKGLGSRVDRHELIGKGLLGLEFFRKLVNDKRFDNMLGILETPVSDIHTYKNELEILKTLIDNGG